MRAGCEHRGLIHPTKRIFVALTFLFASLLLVSCQHEPGSITGRVLDESSDKPVAHATITISGQTIQTSADGIFQIKELKPGDYTLRISAPDYESHTVPVVVKARETVMLELRLSPLKASATVGASGGIVVGPQGFKGEIPAQALAQETAIKISRIESPPPAPEGATFAGPAYEIGLAQDVELLAVPAKLTLPLFEGILAQRSPDTILTVAYWHEQLGWVPIGGELNEQDKTITAEVSHFSWFTSLICRFKKAAIVTVHFVVKTCAQPKTFDPSTLADRLEAAWNLFIDQLGYMVPVPVQQGDKIEAWIEDLEGGVQGKAKTDQLDEELLRLEYLNARLHIDADVDVDVGDVAAHELFHVIQINSYIHPRRLADLDQALWWSEGTAAWAEAQFSSSGKSAVYQRYYQSSRARNEPSLLATPLDDMSVRFHRYLVGIFAQYLTELYGPDIIKETWELISLKRAPLQAIDEVLRKRDSTLSDAYFDFAVQYAYERGPEWLHQSLNLKPREPEPSTDRFSPSQEGDKLIEQNHLSGEAFFFLPAARESGTLKLSFDWGSLPQVWKVKLFIHRFDGRVESVDVTSEKANYEIPNFGFAQDSEVISVAVLAVNASLAQENAALRIRYTYSRPSEAPPPRPATYSLSGRITADGRGLAGVTVTLSGEASATTTTDNGGGYSFSGLKTGSYLITPAKEGYTFSPLNRSVTISNRDVWDQDFTAVSWQQAPLPGGVIIGDYSVAVAQIRRAATWWGQYTIVLFAFKRVMNQDWRAIYPLVVSIVDDRDNEYISSLNLDPIRNFDVPPPGLDRLPVGFTFTAPVSVDMPIAAPITRVRLLYNRDPFQEVDLSNLRFPEPGAPQVTNPRFPEPWTPPAELTTTFGEQIKLDENLSIKLGKIEAARGQEYGGHRWGIPVTAMNVDYNARGFCIRFSLQNDHGVINTSSMSRCPSSDWYVVPGLSTKTSYIGFGGREDGDPGRGWNPRRGRLLIVESWTSNRFNFNLKFVPIVPSDLGFEETPPSSDICPLQAPTLLSPGDRSTGHPWWNATINFTWSGGRTPSSYWLVIKKWDDESQKWIDYYDVILYHTSFSLKSFLGGSWYSWRVFAVDEEQKCNPWYAGSNWFMFSTRQ